MTGFISMPKGLVLAFFTFFKNNTMRIIHFSDFHLRKDYIDRAETIVERLLEALKKVNKEQKIDMIIFSGDLIDKAGKKFEEPKIASALHTFEELVIKHLLEGLSLPPNRFVFTMGNHEVNRDRTSDTEDGNLTDKLRKHADVDWYIHNDGKKEARIEEYNSFRNDYWDVNKCDAELYKSPFQLGIKITIDGVKVGFNCLNTAWRCLHSETDEHKIVTGKSQITDCRQFFADCNMTFAVGHHHPNMMNQFETKTLKAIIAQNYDAFFCGHTHDSDGEYVERPQGSCFYFTAPGTLSVNESEETNYRNGFMVIDYESNLKYVKTQCYYQNENTDFVKDMNYAEEGVWHRKIQGSSIIKPIGMSLLRQKKEGEFLRNEAIDKIIGNLKDPGLSTIQFVALTGLGKTRILHEAFDDGCEHSNYYYCEYSDNIQGLLYDVEQLFNDDSQEDGLLILDNCPNVVLEKVVEKRDSYASKFRIIGVNNEYYDRNSLCVKDCIQLILSQDDTRKTANQYIEQNIPENNGDRSIQDQIKKISDGFPGMAIELVSEYKKQQNVDIHVVDHVVKKMLKFEEGAEKEQEIAMRSMALFQPCPYRDEYKEAFKFIRDNDDITPLYGKESSERRRIFNRTINLHEGSLIETTQSWLNVRPFPLAIWLVEKWFEYGVDEDNIENLISSIEELDRQVYTVIKDGLYKRLNYMQDSVPAQEMMARLTTGSKAPFCNEKVVCSDLGSRLFLAMSSVNPGAVAECLHRVLMPKSIEWVRENIANEIRRNLVWALQKLCFKKESYHNGSLVTALLAVAENESWGNNATGLMKQLFHIMLPGTQASLQDRIKTLELLKSSGKEYEGLVLDCIDRAFDSGSFVRDGEGAQFGIKKETDYMPKDNREIVEYWEQCRDILIAWIDEDPSITNRVAKIAADHLIRWSFDGILERIFPLIEKVAETKGDAWEEMYVNLNRVSKKRLSFYPNEFQDKIEKFKEIIRPVSFCQKLKDARYEIYDMYQLEPAEQIKREQEIFRKLAKEFLDDKVYLSVEELKHIVKDQDYNDIWFTHAILEIIDDEQLEQMLEKLIVAIVECGGEKLLSSFISRLCFVFRERKPLRKFLQKLYDNGFKKLYVRLLANSETLGFMSLDELKHKIASGELPIEANADYLTFVSISSTDHIREIIKRFYSVYPDKVDDLMWFISIHCQYNDVMNDENIRNVIKEIVLKCQLSKENGRFNVEYAQFVIHILKEYNDNDFAIALNSKLIEALNQGYFHKNFEGIYSALFDKYRDVIWNDFAEAFASEDKYGFIYQISDEIGSGFGFGEGKLFQKDDGSIKKLCKKHPETVPCRIAHMVPVFSKAPNIGFSDWVMWLLDNYGDKKDVLDELYSNMNTYSWSGSVIPHLEELKQCMQGIREHHRTEVRQWAENCICELDEHLRRELNREEYMRLHFE